MSGRWRDSRNYQRVEGQTPMSKPLRISIESLWVGGLFVNNYRDKLKPFEVGASTCAQEGFLYSSKANTI